MLTDSELTDNKFLSEVEKYGLLDDFWKLCEQHFGYTDVKPTLEKAGRYHVRHLHRQVCRR